MKTKFALVLFALSVFGFSAVAAMNCNPPSPAHLQRSQQFLQNTPCGPVMTACNAGQYYLNCHKINGKGLLADCAHVLEKGTAVAGVTMQPTDPAVAACKTYCHSNKGACNEERGVQDR